MRTRIIKEVAKYGTVTYLAQRKYFLIGWRTLYCRCWKQGKKEPFPYGSEPSVYVRVPARSYSFEKCEELINKTIWYRGYTYYKEFQLLSQGSKEITVKYYSNKQKTGHQYTLEEFKNDVDIIRAEKERIKYNQHFY